MRATALHVAAVADDVALASALLEGGAQTELRDAEGRTPLHRAARNGATHVVHALLAAGAAVDARTPVRLFLFFVPIVSDAAD